MPCGEVSWVKTTQQVSSGQQPQRYTFTVYIFTSAQHKRTCDEGPDVKLLQNQSITVSTGCFVIIPIAGQRSTNNCFPPLTLYHCTKTSLKRISFSTASSDALSWSYSQQSSWKAHNTIEVSTLQPRALLGSQTFFTALLVERSQMSPNTPVWHWRCSMQPSHHTCRSGQADRRVSWRTKPATTWPTKSVHLKTPACWVCKVCKWTK